MTTSSLPTVPVALFAYARPDKLAQTLDSLRANRVSLIYAFSDAPASDDKRGRVDQVREQLRQIDWCETVLVERNENLGLGRSILDGVGRVLREHESLLVYEDDLVSVPGAYAYLSAALHAYRNEPQVFSVTGWTHPRVTPGGVGDQPYFDGRSECWVWGCWRRSWEGMERSASAMIEECRRAGIDPRRYGCDLYRMARVEEAANIWAVRFIYNHIRRGALCVRPPWTLVEHIGFGADSTNQPSRAKWQNAGLKPCPPVPDAWPEPRENPECPALWQEACGRYDERGRAPGRMGRFVQALRSAFLKRESQ